MKIEFLLPSLADDSISLSPLKVNDLERLYLAASDPLIWINHPSPLRYKREEFLTWFKAALDSQSALVVRENISGKVIGSSRYYEYDQVQSTLAIGYTFLARSHWGGKTNARLKKLMLDHAFQKVKTVWFHVDVRNIRSQKAMEKIGAVFSHVAEKALSGGIEQYVFYKLEKP